MFVSLRHRATPFTQALSDALAGSGVENIFNPSVLTIGQKTWLAFRGLPQGGEKPFRAFLLSANNASARLEPSSLVDLTGIFERHVGCPVADPKLFSLNDRPWVTFNTGHFENPNSIYIAPLSPDIGQPLRVDLEERSKIEKNWGFFEQDGSLRAVYGLDPLMILAETHRTDDTVFMRPTSPLFRAQRKKKPRITLGSQPVWLSGSGTKMAVIAHRRHYFRGKRVYTGRPAILDLEAQTARWAKTPWFHSFRALLGDDVRHNPNLLSCTYFSGLSIYGQNMIVSYGINDVGFAIAEVPASAWPT